eukprot:1530174-Alexandrium_andersonii.AAC.1
MTDSPLHCLRIPELALNRCWVLGVGRRASPDEALKASAVGDEAERLGGLHIVSAATPETGCEPVR